MLYTINISPLLVTKYVFMLTTILIFFFFCSNHQQCPCTVPSLDTIYISLESYAIVLQFECSKTVECTCSHLWFEINRLWDSLQCSPEYVIIAIPNPRLHWAYDPSSLLNEKMMTETIRSSIKAQTYRYRILYRTTLWVISDWTHLRRHYIHIKP